MPLLKTAIKLSFGCCCVECACSCGFHPSSISFIPIIILIIVQIYDRYSILSYSVWRLFLRNLIFICVRWELVWCFGCSLLQFRFYLCTWIIKSGLKFFSLKIKKCRLSIELIKIKISINLSWLYFERFYRIMKKAYIRYIILYKRIYYFLNRYFYGLKFIENEKLLGLRHITISLKIQSMNPTIL